MPGTGIPGLMALPDYADIIYGDSSLEPRRAFRWCYAFRWLCKDPYDRLPTQPKSNYPFYLLPHHTGYREMCQVLLKK